jgi:hypothetical protein
LSHTPAVAVAVEEDTVAGNDGNSQQSLDHEDDGRQQNYCFQWNAEIPNFP